MVAVAVVDAAAVAKMMNGRQFDDGCYVDYAYVYGCENVVKIVVDDSN